MEHKFKTIGSRIRKARCSFGITQEEFAERIGVNVGSVIRWESGSSKPSRFLEQIAKALDVSTDWLLTGEEDRSFEESYIKISVPSAFFEDMGNLEYPTPLLAEWFKNYAKDLKKRDGIDIEKTIAPSPDHATLRALATLDPRIILLSLRLRRLNLKGLGKITTYLNDLELTDAYTLPQTNKIEELPSFLTKAQQKKLRGK